MTTSLPLCSIMIAPALAEELQLDQAMAGLQGLARIERWQGPAQPPIEAVLDALQRAEILVTGWGTPSLIGALRGWQSSDGPLRLVVHTAGSIKHLLPVEALAAGLLVSHSNESLAEAVAEFTVGAILAMRRQMFLGMDRYRAHRPTPPFQGSRELPGSVVGIIGASAIGRRVMDLLRPWRVKLLVYDPYCPAERLAEYGAEPAGLDELFRRSDIVSLHAPITPETIGMLRAEHFAAMKDGALFVNTARGRLVDHPALLAELRRGRISALLDVTDPTEPLPADSPFFELENCVLLPHIAGHSLEARLRQGRYAAEDIANYLSGRSLRYRVLPERWEIIA